MRENRDEKLIKFSNVRKRRNKYPIKFILIYFILIYRYM